ncbi:nuclease-related domain-containing protein [Mesobacillus foraminis]|uniref:Nuclease-like protein n=1 Tax=Mesobacillus foraminis TaxID=279826 RepID=A0A4R2BC68_9BACI|nr:nuclease-related domain-containing protein [Mesobacillus foraminis]TCN24083.1 nuclease-like protein [Mesobacillus foraminis]
MIVKLRFIPLKVHLNHALIPRLQKNHPKIAIIEADTRKKMSGHKGEVNTDFHLQFFDDKNHLIFQGLRLPHPYHYFQIDTIILSTKFILLIETKNHPGSIKLDENQFSQITEHGEKGYTNPLLQVQRHKEQLQDWLDVHHFSKVPIITLVVLSNSSAIIQTNDPRIHRKICKIDKLKTQIIKLTSPYTEERMTNKELKKVSKYLLKEDTPLFPTVSNSYRILPSDLQKGIICPSCLSLAMVRKNKVWLCPHCLFHAKNAHQNALLDYFLLIKSSITNKEFRDFLGISSTKTASNLLSTLKLPAAGTNKGRIYYCPNDFISQLEHRYQLEKQKTKA